MDESTLSEVNRDRLRSLMCNPLQHTTFNLRDAELGLSSATTESGRHDAGLALLACLAHLRSQRYDRPNPDQHPHEHQIVDQQSLCHVDQELAHELANSLARTLLAVPASDAVQDFTVHSLAAEVGLASLALLSSLCGATSDCHSLNEAVLLSIVPYTNHQDPWTTAKSVDIATHLLTLHLDHDQRTDFIVKTLLQETLRPLFSNSSTNLTASGRPSHFHHHAGDVRPRRSLVASAWKRAGNHIIPSFRWAVKASDPTLLANHWPLFLPVLLSLVEDETSSIRENGLHIMALFLEKCPPKTLLSTGIENLFQEAIFPTLLFLPASTPERDSINLLCPAYSVLLQLARLDPNPRGLQRRRLLDRLLRDGILPGFYHASKHVRIVQVLMECTEAIVTCLGLFTAKHLQNLLRLYLAIMSDPFAMAHPPAVVAAAKALNATVINCWPRFSDATYMEQVIHIIALCWLNVRNDTNAFKLSSHESDRISWHLIQTSAVLQSLWNWESCDTPKTLAKLLKREPQLAGLFPCL